MDDEVERKMKHRKNYKQGTPVTSVTKRGRGKGICN